MILKPINDNEFHQYYKSYIDLAPSIDILQSLEDSSNTVQSILKEITEEKWNFKYAPDKWTIKELFLHIIDTERVMAYRALRIARKDMTDLMGFDHDSYVPVSNANQRSPESLITEYKAVRASSISLFASFDKETLQTIGNASDRKFSVRSLGYIISGHETHHFNIVNERYL